MRNLILLCVSLISISCFAGDTYITCWFDDDFETISDATFDSEAGKAMVVVNYKNLFPTRSSDERYFNQYVVVYNNGTYNVFKSNINQGGFLEYSEIPSQGDWYVETPLIDGLACLLTD